MVLAWQGNEGADGSQGHALGGLRAVGGSGQFGPLVFWDVEAQTQARTGCQALGVWRLWLSWAVLRILVAAMFGRG